MKLSASLLLTVLFSAGSISEAYNVAKPSSGQQQTNRRAMLQNVVGVAASGLLSSAMILPAPAVASGGATAGKYTTIPIAKRRYYGRVQASVQDFLALAPAVIKGDMTDASIQNFFDPESLVVVESRRKDVNGQCTKKDGDCRGTEIRDSIYNDMKTSMYLLANAFRINQQKAPDNLPSVRAAKVFFKEMDAMEKRVKKAAKKKGDGGSAMDKECVGHFSAAYEVLFEYLDLVELPPPDSGWYEKGNFSRKVGESARIT